MQTQVNRRMWSWVLKGHGGVTNAIAAMLQDGMAMTDYDAELLEYQVSRLIWLLMEGRKTAGLKPDAPIRNLDQLRSTANWEQIETLDIHRQARGETYQAFIDV